MSAIYQQNWLNTLFIIIIIIIKTKYIVSLIYTLTKQMDDQKLHRTHINNTSHITVKNLGNNVDQHRLLKQ